MACMETGLSRPLLVVLGGVPGTGKTTVARELARLLGAVHIRIDSIEQALRASAGAADTVGDAGYRVSHLVAADNLRLGATVIADSVNPVAESREGWRMLATSIPARILEVELVCSDSAEHRRRIETRVSDVIGLRLPTWQEVLAREYEPWITDHLQIDTSATSPEDSSALILAALQRQIS